MRTAAPLLLSLTVALCGTVLFGYGGALLSTIQAKKNALASERSILIEEEKKRIEERDEASKEQKKEFEIYRNEKALDANLLNCRQCNVPREYEAKERYAIALQESQRFEKVVAEKEQRITDIRRRVVEIDQSPLTPDNWAASGEFLSPFYASVSFILLAVGVGGIAGWLGSVAGHTDLARSAAMGALVAVIVCFLAPVSPLSSMISDPSPIVNPTLANFFRLLGTAGLSGLLAPIMVAFWRMLAGKKIDGAPPSASVGS